MKKRCISNPTTMYDYCGHSGFRGFTFSISVRVIFCVIIIDTFILDMYVLSDYCFFSAAWARGWRYMAEKRTKIRIGGTSFGVLADFIEAGNECGSHPWLEACKMSSLLVCYCDCSCPTIRVSAARLPGLPLPFHTRFPMFASSVTPLYSVRSSHRG